MPDTFLQVDLIVPEDSANVFVDLTTSFHNNGGFGRLLGQKRTDEQRYELVLALQSTSAFPHAEFVKPSGTASRGPSAFESDFYRDGPLAKPNKVFRFVHLWKIRKEADLNLVPLMQKCGEDKDYMDIDELVIVETQNFIFRAKTPDMTTQFTSATRFVRTTRKLSQAEIGVFMLDAPMLFPVLEQSGLRHLGQYQGFSGLLNVVTNFWQTTSKAPLKDMFGAVEKSAGPKSPAQSLKLFKADVRESFNLLPYSPGAVAP